MHRLSSQPGSSARGSTSRILLGSWVSSTRHNIASILAGDLGSVNNLAEAQKWMANKAWIYPSEPINHEKLVTILLTTSFTAKMPSDVAGAIRAVAYLLEGNLVDLSLMITANAITAKLDACLSLLISDLISAKSFLEAIASQQASLVLNLKEISIL